MSSGNLKMPVPCGWCCRYCESRRKVLLDHVHEGYEKDLWEYQDAHCWLRCWGWGVPCQRQQRDFVQCWMNMSTLYTLFCPVSSQVTDQPGSCKKNSLHQQPPLVYSILFYFISFLSFFFVLFLVICASLLCRVVALDYSGIAVFPLCSFFFFLAGTEEQLHVFLYWPRKVKKKCMAVWSFPRISVKLNCLCWSYVYRDTKRSKGWWLENDEQYSRWIVWYFFSHFCQSRQAISKQMRGKN